MVDIIKVFFTLMLLTVSAEAWTGNNDAKPAAPSIIQPEAMLGKYGVIKNKRPVGVGGLTAWTIEKNGKLVVLYTTQNHDALFMGVVWDAKTGKNVSDQFIPNESLSIIPKMKKLSGIEQHPGAAQPLEAESTQRKFAFDGTYNGAIPEAMETVASLAGYKEGKGGVADTLYIIIDPRCPYCRKAYSMTRKYVENGMSIKWIPTVALGDPINGIPLSAAILQSEDKTVLERLLKDHQEIKVTASKQSIEQLKMNLDFMYAAFSQNGNKQAGVPVAFFIDRRNNKPRMMTGISEQVVLEDILGKL